MTVIHRRRKEENTEIIGYLIIAMIGTRPNLSYVVTKSSQHMSKPTKAYSGIVKYALRYRNMTLTYGLKCIKCK